MTPYVQYLEAIRRVLPRDGFLVEEICQAGFTSYFGFPVYEPRTFVSGGHQGTLGFGFPTALGVKVGESRPSGGLDHRRRRLPVRAAGARHRGQYGLAS